MATTRQGKSREQEPNNDVLDLSQQSTTSDDGEFQMKIIQHFQAQRQKNKKKGEAQLLDNVSKEIEECHSQAKERFRLGCDEINTMYDQFCLEQAAIEDEIRTLWMKLATDHITLQKTTEAHSKSLQNAEETRATENVASLTLQRRAIEDQLDAIKLIKSPLYG